MYFRGGVTDRECEGPPENERGLALGEGAWFTSMFRADEDTDNGELGNELEGEG